MSRVAIVGAGEIGGELAHALARAGCVDEILLIDDAGDVAAGKALDIQQAGAVEGVRARLAGASDLRAAAGAAVMVLADPAHPPAAASSVEDRLALLARLAALDADGVMVAALTPDRLLVERGVVELGLPRTRLVGSAPTAVAAGATALVALVLDRSPREVSLTLIGLPPERPVVVWSSAAVGGSLLEEAAPAAVLAGIRRRLDVLPPPGSLSLALAAARVAAAIVSGSRRAHTAFVVLDGELGVRRRAVALPVVLGPAGVRQVIVPVLSTRERLAFDNALSR